MPKYTPIPKDDYDRGTRSLTSKEKQWWLRQKRQGESDALNWARADEVKMAALSGDSIARVIYNERRHLKNGEKGFGALKSAAFCLNCKMPDGTFPSSRCNKDGYKGDGEPSPSDGKPSVTKKADAPSEEQQKILEALGLSHLGQSTIDEDAIRKIAEESAKEVAKDVATKVAALKVEIHLDEDEDFDPIKIEGTHEAFLDALRVTRIHRRCLLHGDKGTGKSTIVHAIAKAMGYEDKFRMISCTQETSIYDLLGARDATGKFHKGAVLEAFEEGYMLFLDEFDALDPATGVALNAILDGCGQASVPQRSDKPTAYRGKGFTPIIAVNTLQGATSAYTGRMKQDGATMNRFPALTRVFVDYSRKVERGILSDSPSLADMLWSLRDKARESKLDDSRIISTRDFHSASLEVAYRNTDAATKNGDGKDDKAILSSIVNDWTDQEKSKCGVS
jgi:MoxR-like ATPase